MNKGSFQINPYKTITIISDDKLPSLEQVKQIYQNEKIYPLLPSTDLETKVITGLLLAYKQIAKKHLQLDLPEYSDNVFVVDIKSIEQKSGEANRGQYCNLAAYVSRQENIGDFANIASHEMAHLFATSNVLWQVIKHQAVVYSVNDGLTDQFGSYHGLNEAVTEMLSHYATDYALANNLINLNVEAASNIRFLSHAQGVHLLDGLLDRHAQGNSEKRERYVNDLFVAYLQGDIQRARQSLNLSSAEDEIIKNMKPAKRDFASAMELLLG